VPEGEGGFSNTKMINVCGYAIDSLLRINNFLQKDRKLVVCSLWFMVSCLSKAVYN
jgi:hypothetical protein